MENNEEKYLSVSEVSQLINVTRLTLYNWEKRGLLVPEIREKNQHRRYREEVIKKFMQEYLFTKQ